ncbi:hypothetical protein ID854_00160 [Xenorhabdus sp. M]|uniref:Uncharacterized protein n=1 Tax=Xenorhabdus szentirmaii TaxID=290112 RepID=A0AAW3YNH0_9GAMM|nr:hypothetical protein [Xenorhabdus sp. M]MBD2798916.1 hypothetical protein [Xenorhabdus sp. M]
MANVTPFEWDYMYFINSGQDPNRVERIINLKFDGFLDFSQGVFFIKDNKIVHYEGYFYDPDSSDEKRLLLNFERFKKGIKSINYYVMSKNNASFLIKKEITPYRIRYWLSYANENQVVRGDVIYQGRAED